MSQNILAIVLVALSAGVAAGQTGPTADHHQHLISPATASLLSTASGAVTPIMARDLIALLDSAETKYALVLSLAYLYGSPSRTVRHGIKLHFGNSDVQMDDPAHVAQLRRVFGAANDRGMAIVVRLRASISMQRPYGRDQAQTFLERVLPAAPDVPVQIAHLAGSGPGEDPGSRDASAVFADALADGDPRMRNVWFDVTTIVRPGIPPDHAAPLAERIRRLGLGRVLYGSDAAAGGNLPPREGWAAFRLLPLTDQEFTVIANTVAPYVR